MARKHHGKRASVSRMCVCFSFHGQVAAADFCSPPRGSEVKISAQTAHTFSCQTFAAHVFTHILLQLKSFGLCASVALRKRSAQVFCAGCCVKVLCASYAAQEVSTSKFPSSLRTALTTTQQPFDVSPIVGPDLRKCTSRSTFALSSRDLAAGAF